MISWDLALAFDDEGIAHVTLGIDDEARAMAERIRSACDLDKRVLTKTIHRPKFPTCIACAAGRFEYFR